MTPDGFPASSSRSFVGLKALWEVVRLGVRVVRLGPAGVCQEAEAAPNRSVTEMSG